MKRRYLSIVLLLLFVTFQLPSARADGQVTIALPSTKIPLTNGALVMVPVSIVCDPLPNTPFKNTVDVALEQRHGKETITGTGNIYVNAAMGLPFFVCDGVTPNIVQVSVKPDANSAPFKAGPATITSILVSYWTGESLGGGGFTNIQSEGAEVGPIAVHLKNEP